MAGDLTAGKSITEGGLTVQDGGVGECKARRICAQISRRAAQPTDNNATTKGVSVLRSVAAQHNPTDNNATTKHHPEPEGVFTAYVIWQTNAWGQSTQLCSVMEH